MPIHDQVASVVNLAKAELMTLDRRNIETPVQTEKLRLMLTTLIELGEPPQARTLADSGRRTVMGHMAQIGEAEKARG